MPKVLWILLICSNLTFAASDFLTECVDLPINLNGSKVGFIKLEAGKEVDVISKKGSNAIIKLGESEFKIDSHILASQTNDVSSNGIARPINNNNLSNLYETTPPLTIKKPAKDKSIQKIIEILDQNIREENKKDPLRGVSVAIAKKGEIIWAESVGPMRTDIETKSTDQIFRVGSISKTFTSWLLFKTIDEGKIKIDDFVDIYVPEIEKVIGYGGDYRITIGQLASHTSGLKRRSNLTSPLCKPRDWDKSLINEISKLEFDGPPGKKFLYSNIGYSLLGLAIQRANKKPYLDLLNEKIIAPYKLENTFIEIPPTKHKNIAKGVSLDGHIDFDGPTYERENAGSWVPAGGLFSTTRDLAIFAENIRLEPRLQTFQSIDRPNFNANDYSYYAYGLSVENHHGRFFVGHNGGSFGYTARFAIEEKDGFTIVLLKNYTAKDSDFLQNDVVTACMKRYCDAQLVGSN
jgi:CubicO group peptidase (beta-lactamase class C family)